MSDNTTEVRGIEFRACGCGCGTPVSGKAKFRPGHDARLVSVLVRSTVTSPTGVVVVGTTGESVNTADDIQNVIDGVAKVLDSKVSEALSFKYHNAAMRAWENHDKKANPKPRTTKAPEAAPLDDGALDRLDAAAVVEDQGTVKVGRWEYPVRMTSAGKAQRNTKRDGSGSWETMDASLANRVTWAE